MLCSMDDILSSWNLHSSKLTKSIIYVGNEANYFAFIEWNFELVYMYGGKIRKKIIVLWKCLLINAHYSKHFVY